MTGPKTSVGIDCRGSLFYVARIDHTAGRQEVKALMRLEREHLGDHHLLEGGQTVLSLADSNVLVKRVKLNGADDDDLEAKFEMAQTLPEDQDQYSFDTVSSGLEGSLIGMIVRRDRLSEYSDTLLGEKADLFPGARYQMRAAALAQGYLNFCRRMGGDLICLADFADSGVSVAFIYQGMVADLCHQPTSGKDLTTNGGLEKLVVELKTLINFKSAALFSEGITTPLSSLIVSGETVSNDTIDIMKRFFTIDINRPAINTGFISSQSDLSQVPLESYLVALGLAAN